jgi:hypothetical protein
MRRTRPTPIARRTEICIFAGRYSRQQQVGDVGAGNQQGDGGEHHEQAQAFLRVVRQSTNPSRARYQEYLLLGGPRLLPLTHLLRYSAIVATARSLSILTCAGEIPGLRRPIT